MVSRSGFIRLIFLLVIAINISFFLHCSEAKYNSADEVHAAAVKSVKNVQPEIFISLLSKKSIKAVTEKMNMLRENFAFIPSNPEARKAYEEIADQMGISIENLNNFKIEHYIRYVMKTEEKGKGGNTNIIPRGILKNSKVKERHIKEQSAEFLLEGDEKIRFINTENGWKLCLI